MNLSTRPPVSPGEDLDGLLRAFYQAQLPHPWPEFQAPRGARPATQATLSIVPEEAPEAAAPAAPPGQKPPWPRTLPEQVKAVRSALAAHPAGLTAEQLARTFRRGRVDRVAELLETLASLGQARALDSGAFIAA